MKVQRLTLKQAIYKIKHKEISHTDLYKAVHEEIARHNSALNIYLDIDSQAVRLAEKNSETELAGVPIAVKDNFLTKNLVTTASSNVLKGFKPPYQSTAIERLQNSGGVVVGKTNMDAWAHGSSTETSDFGPTKNPRNPDYLPGGSSGGSAAAVAADMCIAALGSETAGSIRQPSAWCGTVGLKPTYGRVSRYGVIAMGSSLDSPGPMGKTVYDTALLLNSIAGKDKYDATTSDRPVPDFTNNIEKGVKGLKIGICYIDHAKLKHTPVADAIKKAGKLYESLGALVDVVSLSDRIKKQTIFTPDFAIGVYTVVQRSEVSSNLARFDGIRYGNNRSYFGDEAKRRIMLGTFTLSHGYADKYYVRAMQVRTLYIQNYQDLFSHYDVLLSPTSPGFALPLGASAGNPMFGELEDMLLEPSSIAGLPGISVPCFRDPKTNLYLGMNIIAKQWDEETLLKAAYAYEQHTQWNAWATEERLNG